ncbi:MAG TPA: hypothetical protein VGO78_00035, partial [Acidimicrobiales bacterium]|nr:hypothetical protein [Acidimicrobiales bacterium]
MQRRDFLVRGGAAAAALWLPLARGCRDPWHAPAVRPEGTTLEATVVPARAGAGGAGYTRLTDGPGWPTRVRDDLAAPRRGRDDRRRAVASLVHLTDLHLVDAQSPGRVEFVDPLGEPFTGAFRPQETLTLHVATSMVERVNALRRGPVTGRRFDCAVSTGDNIDNQQLNEARWFVRLLDGGRLHPDSGGPGYAGVQRSDDPRWWHPDEGTADGWKDQRGFPDVPGLLEAATAPFRSPGLRTRWFSTY